MKTCLTSTPSNTLFSSSKRERSLTRREPEVLINHDVKIWYRSRGREKGREKEKEERKDGINGEHEVAQSGRCDIWSVARFKIHTVFSQPQLVRGFTAIEGRRRRRRNSDRFQRGCLFVVWFPFNDSRTTPRRLVRLYYKTVRSLFVRVKLRQWSIVWPRRHRDECNNGYCL